MKSEPLIQQTEHNAQKPYKCSEANCEKAYTRRSSLNTHKKTQHKESLQKDEMGVDEQASGHEEAARPIVERRKTVCLVYSKRTWHKDKLQDEVEVGEQGLVHVEGPAGEE